MASGGAGWWGAGAGLEGGGAAWTFITRGGEVEGGREEGALVLNLGGSNPVSQKREIGTLPTLPDVDRMKEHELYHSAPFRH